MYHNTYLTVNQINDKTQCALHALSCLLLLLVGKEKWKQRVYDQFIQAINYGTPEEMADSTILSFRHSCQPSGNILCFQLPHYCPICGRSLMEEPLSTPPVRYPPILRSSNAYPFSIVIKPTNGSFLGDYNHGDNLHTGITDSKGFLCHFNEQGINYDRSIWHQSLVIPLLDKSDLELSSLWDEKLSQIILGPTWRAECYVELGHNCFDFVVAFLNLVQYNHLKRSSSVPITRQALVDGYILATTSRATKYINFIREIRSRGFLLQLDR